MGIFRRHHRFSAPGRFKIRITTEDGDVLYWHKRGKLHTVEEDVADLFVAGFQPQLFQVRSDGTLHPSGASGTRRIRTVEKVPE